MRPNPIGLWPRIAAVLTGGLLTLMVFFNGRLAVEGTALFASLAAHGTGAVAAAVALLIFALRRHPMKQQSRPGVPLWAYFGGLSGAVTVMLTSVTVNTPLALSGTLALGLGGQIVFGVAADWLGLFGLAKRRPTFRDILALGLICGGSLILIFLGQGAGT